MQFIYHELIKSALQFCFCLRYCTQCWLSPDWQASYAQQLEGRRGKVSQRGRSSQGVGCCNQQIKTRQTEVRYCAQHLAAYLAAKIDKYAQNDNLNPGCLPLISQSAWLPSPNQPVSLAHLLFVICNDCSIF